MLTHCASQYPGWEPVSQGCGENGGVSDRLAVPAWLCSSSQRSYSNIVGLSLRWWIWNILAWTLSCFSSQNNPLLKFYPIIRHIYSFISPVSLKLSFPLAVLCPFLDIILNPYFKLDCFIQVNSHAFKGINQSYPRNKDFQKDCKFHLFVFELKSCHQSLFRKALNVPD